MFSKDDIKKMIGIVKRGAEGADRALLVLRGLASERIQEGMSHHNSLVFQARTALDSL